MKTITFEVEVDDKIIQSLDPSFYDDDAVKLAPEGRLFLCKSDMTMSKKLAKLHRDADDAGHEAPHLEIFYLPDAMRIVKISEFDASTDPDAAAAAATTDAHNNAAPVPEGSPEGPALSTIEAMFAEVLRSLHNMHDDIHKEHTNILKDLLKAMGDNTLIYTTLNRSTEQLLNHFKQSHENENRLQEHQNCMEDRLMNHIQECCDKATLTTKQYAEALGLQLAKITGADPGQPSATNDVPPQALLKAIEIVSGAMMRGAK